MKFSYLLLSLFLFLAACGEKPDKGEAMSLEGYELSDIPGTDMQQALFKDAKGVIMEQGTLRNSKKHGTWVIFRKERDVPQSIGNYVDGVLNGPYFEFAPYGQLSLACSYANNKLHGHYAKYKGVRKAEEGNYVDGQLDGIYKKFYDGSEKVQQEISFKLGKQDGEHLFYNDKSEVTMRYTYKDGEKVSGGVVAKQ
jgi:antitoxin component YwqK of YwqJK toxin-antitoxin module